MADRLQGREVQFAKLANEFEFVAENEERTNYVESLKAMSNLLAEVSYDDGIIHILRLERQCIALEQSLRPDKLNELNQQLLKSSAAEQGILFVMDASAYKAQLEKVFVNGIPELPSGEPYETFVSNQKRHLEASKKNFRAPEEIDFFNARISNLNVGLKQFKALQEIAIFPERVAAKAVAQEIVGENGKVFRADPKGAHCYKGEILAVTETHAIQSYSKNAVYIHALTDFPEGKKASVGDNLAIRYTDGKLDSIERIQPKSQAKAQQKDLGR